MSTTSRQVVLAIGLAGLLVEAIVSHPALATDKVVLFKVTTSQNEIIIGLSRDQLDRLPGKNAEAVTKALQDKGRLAVWQYGARKRENGELEQAPVKKIGLNASADIRVEPYKTKASVVAITEESMADAVNTGAL